MRLPRLEWLAPCGPSPLPTCDDQEKDRGSDGTPRMIDATTKERMAIPFLAIKFASADAVSIIFKRSHPVAHGATIAIVVVPSDPS